MDHESLRILRGKRKPLDKREIKNQRSQVKRRLILLSLGEPSEFFGMLFSVVSGLFVAVLVVWVLLWFLKG